MSLGITVCHHSQVSSLDAKRRSSGPIFLSYPNTHDRFLYSSEISWSRHADNVTKKANYLGVTVSSDLSWSRHAGNVTKKANYLGFTISSEISWSRHADNVTKKENSTIGFLK